MDRSARTQTVKVELTPGTVIVTFKEGDGQHTQQLYVPHEIRAVLKVVHPLPELNLASSLHQETPPPVPPKPQSKDGSQPTTPEGQ